MQSRGWMKLMDYQGMFPMTGAGGGVLFAAEVAARPGRERASQQGEDQPE